jgi:hypothetical protein
MRATGRRRIDLPTISTLLLKSEPQLLTVPGRRQRLSAVIDELCSAGEIEMPRGRSHYDRQELPHLPAWVALNVPRPPPGSNAAGRHPWPPALRWVTMLRPPPSSDDMVVLAAIGRFLAAGGARRPVVPSKERSLELLGDEKRLDDLRRGRLFGPERLSDELLRCVPTPPPFVYSPVASAEQTMLVVENSATYWTFCRLLRAASPIGVLVYGAGQLFVRSVTFAAELGSLRPKRILYFGDLDSRGVEIPWRASREADAAGLPAVEPALPLYRRLAEHEARPGTSRRRGDPGSLEWLPAYLRRRAETLMASDQRIPQEALGLEALSADDGWRAELIAQLAQRPPG